MKKILQTLFHRGVIAILLIVVQAAILLTMIVKFSNYFVYFYGICLLLSLCVALYIINNKSNPAYKIAWIIPVVTMPLFGGLLYLMFGGNRLSNRTKKKMQQVTSDFIKSVDQTSPLLDEMNKLSPDAANQSRYIQKYAGSPPYQGTSVEYLKLGEVKFERMVEELKKAKHFIFMEYFIIQPGKMWNTIQEILVEKVNQGVDVRLIYDDMGSLFTLPAGFKKEMEALGIKCCVFNPFIPVLSAKLNNRDHRKICVIDGYVGFTGGINLADEYINTFQKHGHWKDTAVMLKGEAVWSLTGMFLALWDYQYGIIEDYNQFRPQIYQPESIADDGYVQPFTDNPLDDEPVGETVYLNLINKAKHYVYINTPYLIISNEMITALCSAAKSGVDVRIVTPHIADKWYVHAVTRAYYEILVEAGVKIFEYTPGFIHAKSFVADDEYAVVGTINLDYRSLYLHFECAAWLYRTSCIAQIKQDYFDTLELCQPVTLEECRNVKWYRKLIRALLRIFAPLM